MGGFGASNLLQAKKAGLPRGFQGASIVWSPSLVDNTLNTFKVEFSFTAHARRSMTLLDFFVGRSQRWRPASDLFNRLLWTQTLGSRFVREDFDRALLTTVISKFFQSPIYSQWACAKIDDVIKSQKPVRQRWLKPPVLKIYRACSENVWRPPRDLFNRLTRWMETFARFSFWARLRHWNMRHAQKALFRLWNYFDSILWKEGLLTLEAPPKPRRSPSNFA